jgi:hypothetical protein
MRHFESWREYSQFQYECSKQRRFIRSEKSERFLRAVAETSKSRAVTIPQGRIFWRAQLDHAWRREEQIDDSLPYPADRKRMTPWEDRALEGRANAKGIPCLYVATTKEAAMSEMRPWIGSLISVATFETTRVMNVIDCSKHHKVGLTIYWEEPPPEEATEAVWAAIDEAFADPVTKSDHVADYAPTQTLADLFRSEGFDGLVYKSPFGEEGFNMALFDLSSAKLKNCFLYKTKKVQYEFSDTGEYY